ncbi:MAG: CBS domain-containing protein [Deltaproteobacteria bacterium]
MKVGEACNREVVIIDRKARIVDAARLMRTYHIGDVVVVEERPIGKIPVGIITDRDIIVELIAKEVDFQSVSIEDCMTFELLQAREDDDLRDALERMRAKGVRRIPVVSGNGVLQGILTFDDMIELIAEQVSDLVALMQTGQQHEKQTRP